MARLFRRFLEVAPIAFLFAVFTAVFAAVLVACAVLALFAATATVYVLWSFIRMF